MATPSDFCRGRECSARDTLLFVTTLPHRQSIGTSADDHAGHRSRWFVVDLATRAWHRFRGDWRALPRGSVRIWLKTLAIGFAIACAFSAGVTACAIHE